MKFSQQTYENRVNEQFSKMTAQLALLTAVESGLMRIDSDIEYYRSIKQFLATEDKWGEGSCT